MNPNAPQVIHPRTVPSFYLLSGLLFYSYGQAMIGLRRAELANLLVRDVHGDAVIVRSGKNKKDRMVLLPESVSRKLQEFIKDKGPGEKVFGLGRPAIGMKIKQFAKKAGLTDFHTHSLRHKYATDLLEAGVNIKVVQTLLGHENLNTTQVYLSI